MSQILHPQLSEDFKQRQIFLESKDEDMRKNALARLIDSTALKPATTVNEVRVLCDEAMRFEFCSVCVAPTFVNLARGLLFGSSTRVCTVVGFPNGTHTSAAKAFEVEDAIENGAVEIDFVQNVALCLDQNWQALSSECRLIANAAGGALTKIILETSLLNTMQIKQCTRIAAEAGIQVIKTSTGFGSRGASIEDIEVIASTLASEGLSCGIKASGGIRSFEDAYRFIEKGATRIGTSGGAALLQGLKVQGTY